MNANQTDRKSRYLSRRQFFALSGFGTVGFWLASSDQYAPKMFRALMADAGRRVLLPKYIPDPSVWDSNTITAAWLGHSTVLVNFLGLNILTDPVLFLRVGADLGLGTVGPKRLIAPALTVRELPHIDLVLLSHAHMDHLDLPTLRRLSPDTQVVTAHATADILTGAKFKQPTELRWGESTVVKTRANGDVHVQAVEVKHWGARWRRDTYRGYNGYVLTRAGRKIIFGGDTAMTPTFRPLRNRGPYDLAIMPIGAYQPWVCSHCTPEQSVQMANDAGAQHFLPIHHQTFKLGQEGPVEPIRRLAAALEPERLALSEVGETFSLKS